MHDTMVVEEDFFGRMKVKSPYCDTEIIRRFTLVNENGMSIQLITYGAAITSIKVPDKNGTVEDVVLGFDNLEGYQNHPYYFGCTVGRVTNRISNGTFRIGNKEYILEKNDGPNHLHGGSHGFNKIVWDSLVEGSSVTFSHHSPSRNQGYPGEVMCYVTYQLTDDNEVLIDYKATSTQTTPLNLTNHSYFNLGGHGSGPVYNHTVTVNADYYTPVGETLIPTGEIADVTRTVFDLRKSTDLASIMNRIPGGGFDHNFCVNGEIGTSRLAAKVFHSGSGRSLEVWTTQPGVHFYTGDSLPTNDSLKGKGGAIYKKHGGFCLETQHYPDSVNKPNFPSCIIGPGELYQHTTVFKFAVEE
ncbi:galactose mutarotase [Tachypleus tridentatus]|uniref:galactose mutarotase n=1 Tax=Tachypleus tridentatus TaxID=6853 RepID=UPI003FCFA705